MTTFIATTASNEALLSDADAVRAVLDRYYLDGDCQPILRQDEDGQSYLSIAGNDWPMAWHIPDGCPAVAFVPDWNEDAEKAFEQLLREIASCLAEPLIIQAVGAQACQFPLAACEWHVCPHASEIQSGGFRCKMHKFVSNLTPC